MLCKVKYRGKTFEVSYDPGKPLHELAIKIQLVAGVVSRLVLCINRSSLRPMDVPEDGRYICGTIKGAVNVYGEHILDNLNREFQLEHTLQEVATQSPPVATTGITSSLRRLACDPEVLLLRISYGVKFVCREAEFPISRPCSDHLIKSQGCVVLLQFHQPDYQNFASYLAVRNRLLHLFCHLVSGADDHGEAFQSCLGDIQLLVESLRILQQVLAIERLLPLKLSTVLGRRETLVQVFRPPTWMFADIFISYGDELLPLSLLFLKQFSKKFESANLSREKVARVTNILTAYLAGNDNFIGLVAQEARADAVPSWMVDMIGVDPVHAPQPGKQRKP